MSSVQISFRFLLGLDTFYANYGFHPKFAVGDRKPQLLATANDHANWLKRGHNKLKASLEVAQERMKEYYDHKHRALEVIKVGYKVWLDTCNICTQQPSRKFAHQQIGPFRVTAKHGTHTYKLDLPVTMHIHPVFHVSLLTLKKDDPFQQEPEPSTPIITPEGETQYKVEQIIKSRYNNCHKCFEYFVKWLGYNECTWEPYKDL